MAATEVRGEGVPSEHGSHRHRACTPRETLESATVGHEAMNEGRSMKRVMACSVLLAAIGTAGCAVAVPGGRFDCTTAADCPVGWSCREGLCFEDDPSVHDAGLDGGMRDSGELLEDAQAPIDAPIDADTPPDAPPPPDGGAPLRLLRLAHLIPGAPEIHVCLGMGDAWTLLTSDSGSGDPRALAFREVSRYAPTPVPPGAITAAVYEATAIVAGVCPADTATAIFAQTLDSSAFVEGAYYTVGVTGLPSGGAGEQVPELIVLEDDLGAPPTVGAVRIRLVNAVPNMPASAVSVDLCYDSNLGDTVPPVVVLGDVTFEAASAYIERAPITSGALSVHAHQVDGALCSAQLARTLLPIASDAGGHVATFPADATRTVFFVGNGMIVDPSVSCTLDFECTIDGPPDAFCGEGGLCTHALVPSLFAVGDGATTL